MVDVLITRIQVKSYKFYSLEYTFNTQRHCRSTELVLILVVISEQIGMECVYLIEYWPR